MMDSREHTDFKKSQNASVSGSLKEDFLLQIFDTLYIILRNICILTELDQKKQ